MPLRPELFQNGFLVLQRCRAERRSSGNPIGIPSFSPRLKRSGYLGFVSINIFNPNGVESPPGLQPFQGWERMGGFSQGSPLARPTLGWRIQSRRDWADGARAGDFKPILVPLILPLLPVLFQEAHHKKQRRQQQHQGSLGRGADAGPLLQRMAGSLRHQCH